MSETGLSVMEPQTEVVRRTGEFQADLKDKLEQPAPLPMRKVAESFMCLRDQVLVRPCEREEKSESDLIWLPKVGQERPMEGIVLAVGRGRFDLLGRFWPCEVQVNDRILYGRYAGDEVVVRGETCRLMREEEIKGVIR